MSVVRGGGDDTPREIPEDLLNDFYDQMWQAHEALRKGDLQACLEIAFDGHVDVLKRAGWRLTPTLLWEEIPKSMVKWAVEWRWRPPSPSFQFQSARSRLLWYGSKP